MLLLKLDCALCHLQFLSLHAPMQPPFLQDHFPAASSFRPSSSLYCLFRTCWCLLMFHTQALSDVLCLARLHGCSCLRHPLRLDDWLDLGDSWRIFQHSLHLNNKTFIQCSHEGAPLSSCWTLPWPISPHPRHGVHFKLKPLCCCYRKKSKHIPSKKFFHRLDYIWRAIRAVAGFLSL